MDVEVLEKLIQDDISAAKTPVLLLAYAGSPIVGHVDNIERLQDIAKKNNIWMHVEGHNLATLTMFSVPSSVESAISGDSLTLDLSSWLGVPSLPYITLFKDSDSSLTGNVWYSLFGSVLCMVTKFYYSLYKESSI